MAERNVCSSCSKPASFFCLCTSMKTLLCPMCIPTHVTTRGAHLISPISASSFVKKAEDLDRYNTRLHVVEELTAVLDDMSRRLDIERKAVSSVIAETQTERLSAMKAAFLQAQRDIEELYASLKNSVQAIRDELTHASSVSTLDLSEQSQLFISAASHVRDKDTVFVDLQREIDTRISLSISQTLVNPETALQDVLSPWVCKSRDCFGCSEIRKGLDIVISSPPPAPVAPPPEEPNIFAKLFGAKVKSTLETMSPPDPVRRKPGEPASSAASVNQSREEKPNKSYFL